MTRFNDGNLTKCLTHRHGLRPTSHPAGLPAWTLALWSGWLFSLSHTEPSRGWDANWINVVPRVELTACPVQVVLPFLCGRSLGLVPQGGNLIWAL